MAGRSPHVDRRMRQWHSFSVPLRGLSVGATLCTAVLRGEGVAVGGESRQFQLVKAPGERHNKPYIDHRSGEWRGGGGDGREEREGEGEGRGGSRGEEEGGDRWERRGDRRGGREEVLIAFLEMQSLMHLLLLGRNHPHSTGSEVVTVTRSSVKYPLCSKYFLSMH